jgi:hypothetical protein
LKYTNRNECATSRAEKQLDPRIAHLDLVVSHDQFTSSAAIATTLTLYDKQVLPGKPRKRTAGMTRVRNTGYK